MNHCSCPRVTAALVRAALLLALSLVLPGRSATSSTTSSPGPAATGPQPAASRGAAPATATAPAPGDGSVTPDRGAEEIASLLKIGETLTARRDFASGEIAYRQVLDAPHAGEHEVKTALLGLAALHRRQGALTKAAAIYERFLKENPADERTPDALLELGRTLRDLGVYKLALARFYNVLNSTLKLPGEGLERYQLLAKTAQFEIAETHFQAGDFAEANKLYTRLRLLDLAPVDRARAHFKAAYALRLKGDREGAATALRAFVAQWPDDENVPEARHLLAISLRELGRTEEAFAATLDLLRTEKARMGTDTRRWAYWQRRTGNQLANDFFESGDLQNARALYASLFELSPDPAWRLPISYQLALCHERLADYDRARTLYRGILELAGATPAPDVEELCRMAKWRIEHLDWREKAGQKIAAFFASPADVPEAPAPAPAPAASSP
jgi:TolA-binding protein